MQLKRLNKKGDATDMFIVMVVLFFLAVSIVIGIFVNTTLSSVITTTALNDSAAAGDIVETFDALNATGFQRAYVMIFALMILFVMASAFLVRIHPFWMWIYIIMIIITILTSVFMANVYGALADNPTLGPTITSQPMITFFMEHAVKIALAIGALSIVVVFSKLFSAPTGGSGGGF